MKLNELVKFLFKHGLGELYILHAFKDRPFFGKVAYEKDKLVIKDSNILAGFNAAQLKPCLESGGMGIITSIRQKPWQTLTFYGLENCDMPVDLSKTRHDVLVAAENQYGDSLLDFVGSVYRGFQLMLENHFIPVVLLKTARNKDGIEGLIVSDLRAAPMPITLINTVHNEVRKSVEKHLTLDINEQTFIDEDEFGELFKDFIK